MQKMQAAAGNKPLGPNGQPSQSQIEAMRVGLPLLYCSPSIFKISALIVPFCFSGPWRKGDRAS